MKLIQFTRILDQSSGIGRVASELNTTLKKNGHDVINYCIYKNEKQDFGKGKVIVIPVVYKIEKYLGKWLGKAISVFLFDIITSILSLAHRKDVKLYNGCGYNNGIQVGHSCHLQALKTKVNNGSFSWIINPLHYTCILREFIVFKILKRHFLVAISQKVKHEFITNYSFPSERIKVIPNGVDVSKFKPEQLNRDLKQRLGIPFDKKIFIFVGNEFQRKGLKIILNGIAHCDKKSLENITLLIISRDNPDEYIKHAKKIGIYDICIFLGEIKDVSPYFNISDFAFLMSDYEPFGLVGIEAMASGNILLSTGVDGIADYLIDGENGYITPRTSEHVTHVVTQCLNLEVDVKNNMLINAYNTAQSYAWDKIALEYSEVISKYKKEYCK
ncbi:TPA: glycosyltransferase family 4 protein [Klebsiella pneumoniae]